MADAKKDKDKKPIIKKIKKVQAAGHHGGAWKVAYADFVTAMMAFFLLLWLLSTSSKATLDGIAEFFTPTTGITGKTGLVSKPKYEENPVTVVVGNPNPGDISQPDTQAPVEGEEDALFKQGGAQIQQAFQDTDMKENISVQVTPEGLKIDLIDSDKNAMFKPASAELTPFGEKMLAKMTPLLKRMPNSMSITGHTDGSPVESGTPNYSNWELSADRANAARRYMQQIPAPNGLEAERPQRVTGMGDKELLLPNEPRNPRNRRISLIMLKGTHLLIPNQQPDKAPDLMSAPAQ